MGERSEGAAARCVQVVLSWGGTPQSMIEVKQGGRVVLGDRPGATFLLPSEHVPEPFTLIAGDERGSFVLDVPPGATARVEGQGDEPITRGAITLERGARAEIEIGPFAIFVSEAEPVREVAPRGRRDLASWRWIGASLAFHGAFLASLLFMPPNAGALSFDLTQADRTYIQVRLDAMSREQREETPPIEASGASGAPSSEGQASAGEEGTAGAPTETRATGGGARARGESEDRRIPVTAESVRTMGVLAAASQISGIFRQVSSPFGAAEAQGFAMEDAYGDLMADAAGFSRGFGGLGMNGVGRGGGCRPGEPCGAGTIGVGTLGTSGTGRGTTCTTEEFSALERLQGHAAAVDACGAGGIGTSVLAGRGRNGRVPGPLRVGDPEVLGGLAREQIRRVVSRNRGQIQHCYEQALTQRPDLAGRVTVQWIIQQEGRVASANITGTEMNDSQVEHCMTQAVSRWQFPAAPGVTGVSYPFVFSSTQ